jgi:hypothetical protein
MNFQELSESFDNAVKSSLSFLDNEYISAGLSLVLVIYAGMAAPRLPPSVAKLFDYAAFKLLVFFLIVYVSRKNATIAIIAAVGVLVSLMTLNRLKISFEMMEVVRADQREEPRCKASCGGIDMPEIVSPSNIHMMGEMAHHMTEPSSHFPVPKNKIVDHWHSRGPVPMDSCGNNEVIYASPEQESVVSEVPTMPVRVESEAPQTISSVSEASGVREGMESVPEEVVAVEQALQQVQAEAVSVEGESTQAPVSAEEQEEKVKVVTEEKAKIESKLRRSLTHSELLQLCANVNDKFSKAREHSFHPSELTQLRRECRLNSSVARGYNKDKLYYNYEEI